MEDRIERDWIPSEHHLLLAAVDLGDPVRLAGQELGREIAERRDQGRLDQLDLLPEVRLAGLDLLRLGVAVAGRATVMNDSTRRHEIVVLLDIDAEKGRVRPRLVGHVFDLHIVEQDPGQSGVESRRVEWDPLFNIGVELVAHRRRRKRSDSLTQSDGRVCVEEDPPSSCLRREP